MGGDRRHGGGGANQVLDGEGKNVLGGAKRGEGATALHYKARPPTKQATIRGRQAGRR